MTVFTKKTDSAILKASKAKKLIQKKIVYIMKKRAKKIPIYNRNFFIFYLVQKFLTAIPTPVAIIKNASIIPAKGI